MDVHKEIQCFDDTSSALSNVDQATLPIERTNSRRTYLQHLNEDCLLQIFSSDTLTQMDLCSLAETCNRFKQITQQVFPKAFTITTCCRFCNYGYILQAKNCYEEYDRVDVERILRNFGPLLSKLIVRESQVSLNAVAKYCNSISLKHLHIEGMRSIDSLRVKLKPLFQHLLTLVFVGCHLVRDATTLELNCDSLVELKILQSTGCVAILRNTFPNLERFTFLDSKMYDGNVDSDILSMFVGRHKRFRALNLQGISIN